MAWYLIESGVVIQKQPYEGDGFVEGPDDIVCGYLFDGEKFTPPAIETSLAATDVIAERERRLALGFDFNFQDERGVHHMETTPEDMRKWMDEVTPLAQAYLNLGQPAGEILISTGSGAVTITALEWQQILLAASTWRQPIYQASFGLQAMDPIPADFADNIYWPA